MPDQNRTIRRSVTVFPSIAKNGGSKVKVFVFTVMLAALSVGVASAAGYDYSRCANNNSKACTDARNAYAEHHGGVFPQQYAKRHHHSRHHHFLKTVRNHHHVEEHQNE